LFEHANVGVELGHLLAELGQARLELRPFGSIVCDRLLDPAEGGDDHLVFGLELLQARFDGVEAGIDLETERVYLGAQPLVEAVLQLAERAQDVLWGCHCDLFLSRLRGRGAAPGVYTRHVRPRFVDWCSRPSPATAGDCTDPACPA